MSSLPTGIFRRTGPRWRLFDLLLPQLRRSWSALLLDGEMPVRSHPIAPEKYLDASNGTAASARAYVQGKHFLILGKALDIREKRAEYTWWRTQNISMPSSGSSAGGLRCWPWSSDCWAWGSPAHHLPGASASFRADPGSGAHCRRQLQPAGQCPILGRGGQAGRKL